MQRGEGVAQHGADGRGRVEPGVLRQVPEVVRDARGAGARGEPAGEAGEERRLAGAVLADEPDAVAGRDGERDAVEDESAVDGEGQVADDEG